MAYSSVRVQFEIGHEASIRTKKTPEGFTHDWEVFVRGADNTDIQYFVDKVVFHLHETFPKPRRVTKEPPYVVKESGYAGFVLPIDVYLKNKEEPKKISFQYDLTLQQSGPPVSRVLREPRLFQNPSEDFRRKLIRGGGVGVDTPSDVQQDDLKSVASGGSIQSKSKAAESPVKKHKSDISTNHSFAELFGTPIRRVMEPKKLPEVPKKITELDSIKDKKKGVKHGVFREEKETTKDKDRYSEKDRIKDRDKSKEKPGKKPPSPPCPPPQSKPKEEHKKYEEKEKKKEEHDDKKKRKEEKEKKEKMKEVREQEKLLVEKDHRKDKKDGEHAKKLNSSKPHDPKSIIEKPNVDTIEKEKPEKEKHKHRHKKKEKEKNREKDKHRKEKEKSEREGREREKEKEKIGKKRHEEGKEKEEKVRRKSRSLSPVQERVKKGPLNALLDELGSSDSASPLSEEEPIPSFKAFPKPSPKIVPEPKSQPVNVTPKLKSTNINSTVEKESEKTTPKPEELAKIKKEKSSSKKRKKSEKDIEKKKTKEEHRPRSPSTEREDEDGGEKEKIGAVDREDEKPKVNKDKENRKRKREKSEERQGKPKKNLENNIATSTEIPESLEEMRKSDKFTKEYVAQLKELQHRIMTLEDNSELQKVVNVIAETGQYEITNKTFDFDLCALDFDTVKRLQEFFAPT